MAAASYNITIEQGSDYAIELTIKDDGIAKDLSNYSARGQIRQKTTSTTVTASFTATVTDAAAGKIKVEMSNSVTKNIVAGIYVYDLEIYTPNDANVIRLLEGQVTVKAEVTR